MFIERNIFLFIAYTSMLIGCIRLANCKFIKYFRDLFDKLLKFLQSLKLNLIKLNSSQATHILLHYTVYGRLSFIARIPPTYSS